MFTGDNTLRRHYGAALIHPLTVASVALLLANDIVFKSLWPHAWLTGKLSDLAWMVFAPPLLAFLLSLIAGGIPAVRTITFLSTYAGLPLLYAAFNTFSPVHDLILRGLSLISGGTAGSPLDATDSLVIPIGLGAALWVRRTPIPTPESLRLRWGLLVAGIAALASVATSYPAPEHGIRQLAVSLDGTVYALAPTYGRAYQASDGGYAWTRSDADWDIAVPSSQSIQTPAGTYEVRYSGLWLLRADGGEELAYSTSYLGRGDNVWVQEHATTHLSAREVTSMPYSLVYDERSGNVIAAMGIQGVLVGAPDGRCVPVAVGPYMPTDFSFSGKTSQLLSNAGFLAGALALALTMTALGLLASPQPVSRVTSLGLLPPGSRARKYSWVALAVVVLPLVVLTGGALLVPLALGTALLVGAVRIGSLPPESTTRQIGAWGLGICSFLASAGLLFIFGGSDAEAFSNYFVLQLSFGIPAFTLGIALLAVSWQRFRQWRAIGLALLGMNALVVLTFMIWLHLGIALFLAKLAALILTGALALVLAEYLKRLNQPS